MNPVCTIMCFNQKKVARTCDMSMPRNVTYTYFKCMKMFLV